MQKQWAVGGVLGLLAVVGLGLGVLGQTQSLTVTAYSDAVRFSAQGAVKELRVEVLSLSGQKVFDSGPVLSNALDWKLLNTQGQPVANGVYLYSVTMKAPSGNVTKRLGKLGILRGKGVAAPPLSGISVGELSQVEPLALPPGVRWVERLGQDRLDNFRIQRRPGRSPVTFQTLLQVENDGKVRINMLCLGATIGSPTMSGGDCRDAWSGLPTASGWTDEGAVVRLATDTDNVGIGTTSPATKLHVVGDVTIASDLICTSSCVHSTDIVDGQVSVADLADGAVNSAKILDGSVGTGDLADGAVTLAKLAADSVDASKIIDGSIGSADVNSTQVQLRVSGSCSAGNAIRVVNADGTVSCESVGGAASGWTDDGAVVRLTTSTDRVGIGTGAPNEQLEITGNFRLPPTTATTGIIFSGANRFIHNFGSGNFFAGVNAGNLTMTSMDNTGVGVRALSSITSGFFNTAVGNEALRSNSAGGANTAVGAGALSDNTTGEGNTAVGQGALSNNTAGDGNTAIGLGADVSTGGLTNATVIGANAVVDASNKVRIGNTSVTVIEGQVGFTASSDVNQKENFLPVDGELVLRKISQLTLTSWNYKGHDPQQFRHYGPNAQEFFAAFGHDGLGTIGTETTITSTDIDGIMMIGIQTLYERSLEKEKKIEELTKEIEALKQKAREADELRARLEALEKLVQELMKKK